MTAAGSEKESADEVYSRGWFISFGVAKAAPD
jgi:hypothetical protein